MGAVTIPPYNRFHSMKGHLIKVEHRTLLYCEGVSCRPKTNALSEPRVRERSALDHHSFHNTDPSQNIARGLRFSGRQGPWPDKFAGVPATYVWFASCRHRHVQNAQNNELKLQERETVERATSSESHWRKRRPKRLSASFRFLTSTVRYRHLKTLALCYCSQY